MRAYGSAVTYSGSPAIFVGYRHTQRGHVVAEEGRLAVLLQASRFITVQAAEVADAEPEEGTA